MSTNLLILGRGGEIRTRDHLHPMQEGKPDSTDVCIDLSNRAAALTPADGAAFRGAVRQIGRVLAGSLLTLATLLAACGEPKSVGPAGDRLDFDFGTVDGVRLRSLPQDPLTLGQFEDIYHRAYLDTEACTGVAAPGPLFLVVPDASLNGRAGYTYFDQDLVLIGRTWQLNSSVVEHETVHYLLNKAGFDRESNRCHASPLFLACAGYDPGGCG